MYGVAHGTSELRNARIALQSFRKPGFSGKKCCDFASDRTSYSLTLKENYRYMTGLKAKKVCI